MLLRNYVQSQFRISNPLPKTRNVIRQSAALEFARWSLGIDMISKVVALLLICGSCGILASFRVVAILF